MWRELRLFVLVGALGFVVDTGVLYAGLALGLGPYLGRVVSFLCAAWTTWRLNRTVTFRASPGRRAPSEWWSYLLAMAVGGAVNYAVYCAVIAALGVNAWTPLFAVACGAVPGLAANFLLARHWVFPRGRP
jgi:putative flippase GtrA